MAGPSARTEPVLKTNPYMLFILRAFDYTKR